MRNQSNAIFVAAASVVASFVASCAAVSHAQETTTSTTATPVVTVPLDKMLATTPNSTAPSAINVLLVPLEIVGASVSAVTSPSSPGSASLSSATASESSPAETFDSALVENVSPATNVGASERAAAPLRRALVRLGFSDVLSAPLQSSVVRRAVEEKRLPQRVIDDLASAMRLVATATASETIAPITSTREEPSAATTDQSVIADSMENATSSPAITPSITMSVMRSAAISENLSARRKAVDAAARLGRLLGYRAVVTFAVSNDDGKARVVFLLVDSLRESGAILVPNVTTNMATNGGGRAFSLAAADSGSTLLQGQLGKWDVVTSSDKSRLAESGIARARTLLAAGNATSARDEINTALALDPSRRDVVELLGDILLKSGDAKGAVAAYNRVLDAADANSKGAAWSKVAQAYVAAKDWPNALMASEQALAQKTDSLELRLAMAQAQIGRAQLFQAAERAESANLALENAETHLEIAAAFAPDEARVTRLQVQQLTLQTRSREALSLLDRVATQFPNDAELQANYATLLLGRAGREAEAFRAWARAWSLLSNNGVAPNNEALLQMLPAPDRLRYRRLVEGFDLAVGDATKVLYKLTERVLEGDLSREDAISQARAPMLLVSVAGQVLKALPVPDDRLREGLAVRLDAADKMAQAVAAYSLFLENGEENFRDRATELHKSAVAQLNALRAAQ